MINTAKLKNVAVNFIIPIICMGVSLVLFVVIIYPSFRNVPALQQKLRDTVTLRDQLKEKQAKLGRFIDFKDILEENSNLVDRVMPAEQNVPGLLDQLSQIASEVGLDVTKLSYSLSDIDIRDETAPAYNVVLVSLGADANYQQMVSFMKAVENASRLVNISNFRFNSISLNDAETLSITFVLSAPYMKVQSSAVTDEPIPLDITSGDFASFINKVKTLRYFEKSGDSTNIGVEVTAEEINADAEESSQSSQSD